MSGWNLPPGVTGTEYEIAGPDFERDEHRECSAEGFTLRTITQYGETCMRNAVEALRGESNVILALAHLHSALSDIATVDVDAPCPFSGDVTVQGYRGTESWECPVCRKLHEEEPDDER